MDSLRQQKVAKQIKNELGDIFVRDGSGIWGNNVLVTLTRVHITRDLQVARVYLSVFGVTEKSEILKKVQSRSSEIRYLLGNVMRHQLRVIPSLEFFEDDSLDYIENIDRLLKE